MGDLTSSGGPGSVDRVSEIVVEESRGPPGARGAGRGTLIGIIVGVVLAGLVLTWLRGGERPTVTGVQTTAPSVQIGSAAGLAWRSLTAVSGPPRADFPVPMVSTTDGVCFGFARLDFEPPSRPSVARCVADPGELPDNGIRSLVIYKAGHDNWHLVQMGRPAGEVAVTLTDGTRLDGSRLHVLDDLVALRLPLDTPARRVEWIVGRERVVCEARTDATTSGQFCTAVS